MKYLKILLLFISPLFATAQPLGTWPVQYGDTPPTHTPSGSGTRIYLNISTNELYNWNPAPVSSWVKYPKGFDQISGCAAPGYTPTARQSVFAVNSCTALQNGRGPELYQYTGSQWVCLNCYPAYTAGTGIGISSGVITNTAPDQVVSISGVGITPSGTYPNFTLTAADQSATNELQNLSLSGQSLGISSGTGVTLPVVGVTAGTGIGVSSSSGNFTVSNTGDLSTTNELNTSFSVSGSNLALTDAGGTINVPVSSIAPVQAVVPGSGIFISGTTTRTITAADVSDTNELQTLSISGSDLTLSNGGGTVTLPGGSITWPLLAPDGDASAPSYSFSSLSQSGLWMGSKAMTLSSSQIAVEISTGNQSDEGVPGAGISIKGGASVSGDGSTIIITGGESEQANGGSVNVTAGNGFLQGGNFSLSAGNASGGTGGNFDMLAGASSSGPGGQFNIVAGGGSTTGGNVVITPGAGPTDADAGKVIIATCAGVVFPSLTSAQLSSLVPEAGQTVFCTDATANDSSTGVLKTYNGSTWKNHW